jgi:protein translocase SecG subunit
MLNQIITILNIASAILIIIAILLQNRGSSLSGALGGDAESFYTRRGADKVLFTATIILGILFAGSVLAQSIIN